MKWSHLLVEEKLRNQNQAVQIQHFLINWKMVTFPTFIILYDNNTKESLFYYIIMYDI